jgi:hypothetical protein
MELFLPAAETMASRWFATLIFTESFAVIRKNLRQLFILSNRMNAIKKITPKMEALGLNRRGNWFLLASGRRFWPLDPRPSDIFIEDIAHALGNICRFGGHSDRFYSVAQHSLLVESFVEEPFKRSALLHDAPEAFIGDMIRPLKYSIPQYREIENNLWRVIAEKFGLHLHLDHSIKDADNKALRTEQYSLFPEMEKIFEADPLAKGFSPAGIVVNPMSPFTARTLFLRRFQELFNDEK